MILTDGRWSMAERNAYFLAAGPWAMDMLAETGALEEGGPAPPLWVLIAVNDLNPESESEMAMVTALLDSGARVLLDSGVFWLTNRHKRRNDMTMDQALALHPDDLDGFDWLWDRYLKLHSMFGDRLWGTIELDQGGAERKRETRQRLHDLGVNPIPVYHPFVDGWDYFDELAENYDRLCFGNVVQADPGTRQRLLLTAYERKRKYPHLWIHLLGYSMNEWLFACPVESCDSSSWLTIIRWAASARERAMCKTVSAFPTAFRYDYGQGRGEVGGHQHSGAMSAAMWRFNALTWLTYLDRLEEEFADGSFR